MRPSISISTSKNRRAQVLRSLRLIGVVSRTERWASSTPASYNPWYEFERNKHRDVVYHTFRGGDSCEPHAVKFSRTNSSQWPPSSGFANELLRPRYLCRLVWACIRLDANLLGRYGRFMCYHWAVHALRLEPQSMSYITGMAEMLCTTTTVMWCYKVLTRYLQCTYNILQELISLL